MFAAHPGKPTGKSEHLMLPPQAEWRLSLSKPASRHLTLDPLDCPKPWSREIAFLLYHIKRLLNPPHILTRGGVKHFRGSGDSSLEPLMRSGPVGSSEARKRTRFGYHRGWECGTHSSRHHCTVFQLSFLYAGTTLPYVAFFVMKEATGGIGKSAAYNMSY